MAPPILLALVLLVLAATAADSRTHPFPAADSRIRPSSAADLPPEHQKEFLAETLANLGYHQLAMAVKSLHAPLPSPVTVFAPSDDAFRRSQYSPALLLRVHLAPGLLSAADLARLPSGSKLDLGGRRRCLTVNSAAAAAGPKIFVHGVEITHPDLFNDGRIAIHGLRSVISPLSPLSFVSDPVSSSKMLREAITVLQNGEYGALVLEMDGLGRDLALLHNLTLFVLEGQSFLACDFKFHIVPDRLLTHADLMQLPEGTVLPTLAGGLRRLTVTRSGAAAAELLQINGLSIKTPDMFCNAKIAVHGITEPFSPAAIRQRNRVLFYLFTGWLLFNVQILVVLINVHNILSLIQKWLIWCGRDYGGYHRRFYLDRRD